MVEHATWQIPRDFEGIIAYNPRHDIQDFLDLKTLNGKVSQQEYFDLHTQTINRTRRQLEKAIGERFLVEKSTIEYYVDSAGRLRSEDYEEPVIARYERGQRFLEGNGSTEIDREKSEVQGLKEVERILATSGDTTVVIASPRSEDCKHGEEEQPKNEPKRILYHANFFDIYVKKGIKITMVRLHSTHSYKGFLQALAYIDPNYPVPSVDQQVNATYMLANPAQTTKTTEEIMDRFALDIKTQDYEDNLMVLEACTSFFLSYINTLVRNPLDVDTIKLTINTIYNVADKTVDDLKRAKKFAKVEEYKTAVQAIKSRFENFSPAAIQAAINISGRQKPKSSGGGPCPGEQRGFEVTTTSLIPNLMQSLGTMSVAEGATIQDLLNSEDTNDFPCPRCGFIIEYGAGIEACPGCGLDKTCA